MILCVTLNPCLDKTLTVTDWRPGDNVRATAVREVVGGKGNNVARALTRLGHPARPLTFLGGATGARCDDLLRRDDGLDPIVIPVASTTRTILTVRAPGTPASAFFDPDSAITPDESSSLIAAVEVSLSAGGVEAITLSGSSPGPSTHHTYPDLIALARARRVPAFLDTYGPPLDALWGVWPEAITLNRREAGLHLRNTGPTDVDILGLLRRWSARGVALAVVTDGPGPVLAICRDRTYRATPPAIESVNPIGSGDCLLAGLVSSRLRGDDPEAILRFAIACAVANATTWDAGGIDPGTVGQVAEAVGVEEI